MEYYRLAPMEPLALPLGAIDPPEEGLSIIVHPFKAIMSRTAKAVMRNDLFIGCS